MKPFFKPQVYLLAVPLVAAPAYADLQLSEKGVVAYLKSNRFEAGDEQTFQSFLDKSRPQSLKIIYLNSRGGRTQTAIAIGRMIRSHGLDTAFKPSRDRCVSACTTVFVGGVHRFYIGGGDVSDGVATHFGLGFHPSGAAYGEETINRYYDDMGVHGALALRYKLFPKDAPAHEPLFFAGGRSAIDAGVATSLSEPEDKDLRD